ncbi:HAD domain-containing protein [Amycolatopsis sp. cg5]|uniref:HAD domain-containing protein n=1 Tax=Amycolatopsis sp. cg5 TaxID=3238802 RepID=UPI0035251D46
MRPLLLLDIDGPLNPFAAKPDARPPGFTEHRFRLSGWSRRKPLRMWLNPGHGPALLALAERTGLELAWATTWEHRANTMIGPAIGLPSLPVITFAGASSSWKYPAVARFAYERPLAWLDDDFDLYPGPRDAFLAKRAQLPTELIRVNPREGLSAGHLAAVESWVRALP